MCSGDADHRPHSGKTRPSASAFRKNLSADLPFTTKVRYLARNTLGTAIAT